MKPFPGLIPFLVLPTFFFQPAKAQTPAEPSIIDRFPEAMKQADEEVAKKFEAARAIVEEEVKEKRLSDAIAQSLRWSLRTASGPAIGDARSVISSARVPVENVALTKAFRELETTNAGIQTRKNELMADVKKEMRQRVATTIATATKAAVAEATRAMVERVRDALREAAKTGYTETQELDQALNILASTKRLLEAEAAGEARKIDTALLELSNQARSGSTSIPTEEIKARIERVVQPLVKNAEERRTAFFAALEGQKPAAEVDAALNAYSEAADRVSQLPQFTTPSGTRQNDQVRTCRALASALKLAQSGDMERLPNAVSEARSSVQQMSGTRATSLLTLLDSLMKQAEERVAKERLEQTTGLKTRLAAVKKPAELGPILTDLEVWIQKNGRQRNQEWSELREVHTGLSTLATAWSSGSLALLQPQNRGGESAIEKSTIAKEFEELRKRVEREVMSRALAAPELNEGEALALPLETAVDQLCDTLFTNGDWRRLYRVLETRSRWRVAGEYQRQPDETLTALRAFFAGQNLELAEQWAEAAESYRAVLRCVSERAPIKPAAERLKVLVKEHPEAVGSKANAPAK